MLPEIVFNGKAFGAYITGEGPLVGVCPHVLV